jgi:hypothetical protein
MSDSNGQKKGIDGKNIALVLMTLGGVGGYLWLDHKLRLERQVNADLTTLLQLAALQAAGAAQAAPVRWRCCRMAAQPTRFGRWQRQPHRHPATRPRWRGCLLDLPTPHV